MNEYILKLLPESIRLAPRFLRRFALELTFAGLIWGAASAAAEPLCPVKVALPTQQDLSFHPTRLHFPESSIVGRNTYITLFDRSEAGEILPLLAKSWIVDRDKKSLTVKLNPSCRWSSGESIVSEQVADGIRLLFSKPDHFVVGREHIQGANRVLADGASVYELDLEVIDRQTLRIGYTTSPDMLFYVLSSPAYTPLRASLRDIDIEHPSDALPVISSGPYVVKSQNQKRIVLGKNRFFCTDMIGNVNELHFVRDIPLLAKIGALSNGRVDVVFSTPPRSTHDIRSRVSAGSQLKVRNSGAYKSYYLVLNQQNLALRNPEVKTAIRLAIDHELLQSNAIFSSQAALANSYAPPYPGYHAPKYVWREDLNYAERRSQAKALMLSQGYGPDKPMKVRMLNLEGNIFRIAAEALSGMLKGLYIELEMLSKDSMRSYLIALKQGDYDIGFISWTDFFPDPSNSLAALLTLKSAPDELEKPLEASLRESFLISNRAERFAALADIERKMQSVGGVMPLYRTRSQVVSRADLDLGQKSEISARHYRLASCKTEAQ